MMSISLTENAQRVLEARYLRRDSRRMVIETPEQLFERVARGVAQAELLLGHARQADYWQKKFFEMLRALDFLPNSPTLMNAGTPIGQLSACFVLPVEDTMESIFEAIKQMALVQRTGGGTGFSFSRLRPKGDVVASTGGESSGPVSFMKIFDCATENIKLGGRRRGANMGVLRIDHPDILEFIEAKLDEASLQNFNLSVGVTNAFMEAVRRGESYELTHPNSRQAVKRLNARDVFDRIALAAWRTGDPGLLFVDTINHSNPTPHLGSIEATNPCGEIPLLPYEPCNLGSINLAHMVRQANGSPVLDWEKLESTVRWAMRFLDDVIEVSRYPTPEIARMAHGNRKTGLGVMGFADMLVSLGISYDSDEAVSLAGRLMGFIARTALSASEELAQERGVFPNWRDSVYEARGQQVRNATCTAIAPTGTISIIAGTSASIEPLFALAYRRSHVLGDQSLLEINPLLEKYIQQHKLDADELVAAIMREGSLKGVPHAPEEMKRLFVTALEVRPERHLEVQAAFQRHVDNSVSKTVNLPYESTPQDVAHIYMKAWDKRLKGITIYRYGSKALQVLELGAGDEPFHYDHSSKCDQMECRI